MSPISPIRPVNPLTAAERARREMLGDYAAKAGRASQASGRGHRWSSEDAKHWGRLGGQCSRDMRRQLRKERP
jgi:hypothetical protein